MNSSRHTDTLAAVEEHCTMYVAFELGKAKWKLGIVVPGKTKLSRYVVDGGDVEAAWRLMTKAAAQAKKRVTMAFGCTAGWSSGVWRAGCSIRPACRSTGGRGGPRPTVWIWSN